MISLSAAAKRHGMRLITETDSISALSDLYAYLGMNGIIPESVIVTRYSDELAGFIGEFGFSTGDGKPGIAAALHDPSAAAEAIPLGCVLVRTDCAVDIQGLAALPQSDRFPLRRHGCSQNFSLETILPEAIMPPGELVFICIFYIQTGCGLFSMFRRFCR